MASKIRCFRDRMLRENPAMANAIDQSLSVITGALHVYDPEELCFSFNGGKDSTVVLQLLRAACEEHDERLKLSNCTFKKIKHVYFYSPDEFPEVSQFIQEECKRYSIELQQLPSFKDGMPQLIDQGMRATFLGTRDTDPNAGGQEHFSPTSPGWPGMMRINPILRWTYSQVWLFLRSCDFSYCSLYELGYTSLGSVHSTQPNPYLLHKTVCKPDEFVSNGDFKQIQTYDPAWKLTEDNLEREGRQNHPTKFTNPNS